MNLRRPTPAGPQPPLGTVMNQEEAGMRSVNGLQRDAAGVGSGLAATGLRLTRGLVERFLGWLREEGLSRESKQYRGYERGR